MNTKLIETITPEAISALPSGDGQALGYDPVSGRLVRIPTGAAQPGTSIQLGTSSLAKDTFEQAVGFPNGGGIGHGWTEFQTVRDDVFSFGFGAGLSKQAGAIRNFYCTESRYQNSPLGVDTENYLAWDGPTAVTRRLFQINTSWGVPYGAPATHPEGFTNFHISADRFNIGAGATGDEPFSVDLSSTPKLMRWNYDFTVNGATTLNGALTLGGAAYIAAGASAKSPAATPFTMQSTGSVLSRCRTEDSGDAGMEFGRTSSSSEKLLIGAAAGGSVFGSLNNAFAIDWVTPSATRPILFRSSTDGGTTRTTRFALLPNGIAIASNSAVTSGSDANGATNAIFMEGGTAPSGNPTACGILWYDNSDKSLKTRDTSGRICSFGNALKTEDPPSGTAAIWKLGSAASVTPTSPNRTIHVNIGGTSYYIAAKTTND